MGDGEDAWDALKTGVLGSGDRCSATDMRLAVSIIIESQEAKQQTTGFSY